MLNFEFSYSYAECQYAEELSVFMLNVIMLSFLIFELSAILLRVIMQILNFLIFMGAIMVEMSLLNILVRLKSHKTVAEIISLALSNAVTPEGGAKHELVFNKLVSVQKPVPVEI